MTREEHLEWAKKRALEYLDAGDNVNALASMLSDIGKHPELENHPGKMLAAGFILLPGWIGNSAEVRRWIVGFN